MMSKKTLQAFLVLLVICALSISLYACSAETEQTAEVQTDATVVSTSETASQITTQASVSDSVEVAYNAAVNLTKDQLDGYPGHWEYRGIPLLPEDCDWVDNPINDDGIVNQGAMYRKMAMLLEGFNLGGDSGNSYDKYAELLIGFEPQSRDEFSPYVANAKKFIVTENPLQAVMKAFESLDCVDGSFDYSGKLGNYDLTITSVNQCAKDLQITKEMLGYTIAMLTEYGSSITFDGNACHIVYDL